MAIAFKALVRLSFLCVFATWSSLGAITITFSSPTSNSVAWNGLYVDFDVASDLPVSAIEVLIDDVKLDAPLDPNSSHQTPYFFLPSLAYGMHNVIVRATDNASNVGESRVPFRFTDAPIINVTSPMEQALGRPDLQVNATATDSDGDVTLKATVYDDNGERVLAEGTNSIQKTFSVAGRAGLTLQAVDRFGALSFVQLGIYGTTNRNLFPEFTVPGELRQVDGDHVLYVKYGTSEVVIADRRGNISMKSPARPDKTIGPAHLTSYGAIYHLYNTDDHIYEIWEMDSAGASLLADGYFLRRHGNYALYLNNPERDLYVRDLTARTSRLEARELSSGWADLGANGKVAYEKGGAIYFDGALIDTEGEFPITDGKIVAYVKSSWQMGQKVYNLYCFDPDRFFDRYQALTQNGMSYPPRIENGWITFIGASGSVIRRDPTGVVSTILPGVVATAIQSLSPEGDVTWFADNTTGYINTNSIGVLDIPCLLFFQDGRAKAISGGTLLSIGGPALAARKSGANTILSWNASDGYFLERTTTISEANWTRVNDGVVNLDDRSEFQLPNSTQHEFYRLVK